MESRNNCFYILHLHILVMKIYRIFLYYVIFRKPSLFFVILIFGIYKT